MAMISGLSTRPASSSFFSNASAGGQLEQPSEVNNSRITGGVVACAVAGKCSGASPETLGDSDEMRANTKTQRTEPITRSIVVLTEQRSMRSEEHTSELQSRQYLVCRLLLDKKT